LPSDIAIIVVMVILLLLVAFVVCAEPCRRRRHAANVEVDVGTMGVEAEPEDRAEAPASGAMAVAVL